MTFVTSPANSSSATSLTALIIDHARRHGGVITRAQAHRLGAGSRLLTELGRSGVLVRAHPGVYVLGGAPRDHVLAIRAAIAALARSTGTARRSATAGTARRSAAPTTGTPTATAAGQPPAVASHASAAWIQGLIDTPPAKVHVTAGSRHRHLHGVVVHRAMKAQDSPASRSFGGVACTTPARTLVDLAASATPAELADAVDRALSRRLVLVRDVVAETATRKGARRGAGRLRWSLAQRGFTNVPAPSVLESRMSRVFVRFNVPPATPEHIAGPAGEYRIDYAYAPQRVAVEVYGYSWHHSPAQMTRDLARQRKLTIDGWQVLIYTWQDVTKEPERVAHEIRTALSAKSQRADRPA
jgi:predicted transcriptional regulator of viral defense system